MVYITIVGTFCSSVVMSFRKRVLPRVGSRKCTYVRWTIRRDFHPTVTLRHKALEVIEDQDDHDGHENEAPVFQDIKGKMP
jgi:hypothetical protein